MTWKQFIIEFLGLASVDVFIAVILYLLWKYLDLKYFSTFDIETLRRENEYLKQQNRNLDSSTTEFWGEGDLQ